MAATQDILEEGVDGINVFWVGDGNGMVDGESPVLSADGMLDKGCGNLVRSRVVWVVECSMPTVVAKEWYRKRGSVVHSA